MDWTSQLQEELMHHILSFLSTREATRTSVLSKTWLRAWSTHPNLDFSESYFQKNHSLLEKGCGVADLGIVSSSVDDEEEEDYNFPLGICVLTGDRRSDNFVKFVHKTLLRYLNLRIPIQSFSLSLPFSHQGRVLLLDFWIKLLVQQNCVKELSLQRVASASWNRCTLLPFASKSLKTLKLSGFFFKNWLCGDTIGLESLQKLILYDVCVDENVLHSIISGCRQLEELCVEYCDGLTKLKVVNLHKLKKVKVSQLEEVEISSSSLQCFNYWTKSSSPGMFNIDSCQGLKDLRVSNLSITDHFLHNIMSKLPLLEDLALDSCNCLERLKISNLTLKNIVVHKCRKLLEAEIAVPNLLSFAFDGCIDTLPTLCFARAPCRWKVTIDCFGMVIDLPRFVQLRRFVMSLNQYYGELRLKVGDWQRLHIENLKETPLPLVCEIEHLMLKTYQPSECHESLLDALFCSFHPKSMSVKTVRYLDDEPNLDLIKRLRGMLIKREEEDPYCCSAISAENKCWRHQLKEVKIGRIGSIKGKLHLGWKTICFKLKW